MAIPTVSKVLTPPGTGAIAVVRVSGPKTRDALRSLFRGGHVRAGDESTSTPIRLGTIIDQAEVIDEVLVTEFEMDQVPVADICAHGGVRTVERILSALEREGVPLAQDGLGSVHPWPIANLIEAEVDELLVGVKTKRAALFLAWQRANLYAALCEARTFSETASPTTSETLRAMLSRSVMARLLVSGATVALVGPPNSGKSTLLNYLVGRQAAVTSTEAGTTRDWVTEEIDMDGVPLTLIDTAGHRATHGVLESDAIERGTGKAADADLILFVMDGSQPVSVAVVAMVDDLSSGKLVIPIANKADLASTATFPRLENPDGHAWLASVVEISSLTGSGIEELKSRILRVLGATDSSDRLPSLLTPRQEECAGKILGLGADADKLTRIEAWDEFLGENGGSLPVAV